MASELEKHIIDVFNAWGKTLVKDMKKAIHEIKDSKGRSINHGGGQSTRLEGSVDYKTINTGGVITFQLIMDKHWKNVEDGRGANKKPPPSSAIEKFIRQKNLPVDKILLDINLRHRGQGKSLNGMKITKRSLKSLEGRDNFDKKVKTLSWLIARSIGKKGIEPRPFINKVITQERLTELKEMLAPVIKNQFILDINK